MKVRLVPLFPQKLQVISIADSPFSIGRSVTCDLQLDDSRVSRRHCAPIIEGEPLWVTDLQSSNGTFVNNRRVDQRHALRHDDDLGLANIVYRVEVQSSGPTKNTPSVIALLLVSARLRSGICAGFFPALPSTEPQPNPSPGWAPPRRIDEVDRAGSESFPASDPPAWTKTRA